MTQWFADLSPIGAVLLVLGVLLGGSVLAALVGALLLRMGMQRPSFVEWAGSHSLRLLTVLKRPLTIVVLDEVAAVIQTGHYTKNISDAIRENHDELKDLVAEKLRDDPNARLVSKLPGYEALVSEVTDTVMRVLIEMLADPRMDELVSDALRNNLEQIRRAVRERAHEDVGPPAPPDPIPASAPGAD